MNSKFVLAEKKNNDALLEAGSLAGVLHGKIEALTKLIDIERDTRFFAMKESEYYLITVPDGTSQDVIDDLVGRLAGAGLNGSVVSASVSIIKIG